MQELKPKDPQDVVDYPVEWADVLELDGDTLTSATWTFPEGLTKQADAIAGTQAVVWIAGGTDGERYEISCLVVTAGGRTYDRTFSIVVRQS